MKRIFDLVVSIIILVFGFPIMVIIGITLLLIQGRPIIFRQLRPGLNNRLFSLYKFRTMSNNTDEDGKLLPDANRISRIGHFLRSTSLDELPTLWNVLKGEMSLVGPRPLLVEYLDLYTLKQARRHEAKPGITGWAQINGRNAISWEEKFKLDVWYVDNQSVWLDIKILIITIWKVIKGEGISQSGHVTMEKFHGKK